MLVIRSLSICGLQRDCARIAPRWFGPVAAIVIYLAYAQGTFCDADELRTVDTPSELLGDWGTSFGSLGPVTVHVTSDGATITSKNGDVLGSISGTFSASSRMNLTVFWQLPAFQLGQANPMPASAWPGAVSTDLTLQYDASSDELRGTYGLIDIGYSEQGQYQTRDRSSVDIRLIHTLSVETGTAAGPGEQP
jgi:hypothetical protein